MVRYLSEPFHLKMKRKTGFRGFKMITVLVTVFYIVFAKSHLLNQRCKRNFSFTPFFDGQHRMFDEQAVFFDKA